MQGTYRSKIRARYRLFILAIAAPLLAGHFTTAYADDAETAKAKSFDRDAWLQDYRDLKTSMERTYSNLAWFASPESGVNLPTLDRRAERALKSAESDADAEAAILAFVAGFHDGHFSQIATQQSTATGLVTPAKNEFDKMSAAEGCAALGFAPATAIAFSLPFESLNGTQLQSDGVFKPFRAAVETSPQGKRIGIVRIPRFRSEDAPPDGCEREWAKQLANKQHIDPPSLRENVSEAWFAILAAQLKHFSDDKVDAVLVDVGGNSGGNDSGDWATRMFTTHDVHSARLLMATNPEAISYFDEQLTDLHNVLKKVQDDNPEAKKAIQEAIAAFEQRKSEVEKHPCDMSWVWSEQRHWSQKNCNRLTEAGFSSGQNSYLAKDAFGNVDAASSVYWPAAVDAFRGAWSGPVYVLTDNRTASSAEMFAATMHDNGIAKIVGRQTAGDGCGFMTESDPLELHHSHLRFRVPNCVRLRADGTDEVSGIKPDLSVLPTEGESGRARAFRVLGAIDADLAVGKAIK